MLIDQLLYLLRYVVLFQKDLLALGVYHDWVQVFLLGDVWCLEFLLDDLVQTHASEKAVRKDFFRVSNGSQALVPISIEQL